jgi:hypothetical protein
MDNELCNQFLLKIMTRIRSLTAIGETITEQVLEKLFGLVDTRRDPLSAGVKSGANSLDR